MVAPVVGATAADAAAPVGAVMVVLDNDAAAVDNV